MTIYSHNPNDLAWGDIRGELPWAHLSNGHKDHVFPGGIDLALSEQDRYCFECPLPECDQKDECCPFNDDKSSTKRAYDLAYKAARREVEKAVREIEEARCAT